MSRFRMGEVVEVLDGSTDENYVGGWANGMDKYVGKVGRVVDIIPFIDNESGYAYQLDFEDDYWFDENYLQSVERKESVAPSFSYREVRRIKDWLEHNRDKNAIPLSIGIDWEIDSNDSIGYTTYSDDSSMIELLLDALEWFTEFYEGE